MSYKLTYATMFDPPADLHVRFDAALAGIEAGLGAAHTLHIDGKDCAGADSEQRRSPIDQRRVLGQFALANVAQANQAMEAAQAAFAGWRATSLAERVRLLKRVAALIEERVYSIAAALTLEVGKNRMEALGEVQETADFFRHYAEDFERQQGYDHVLPDDPLPGFRSRNRSVMRPYGVWVVIAPFNFPFALAGGPVAAALVTGNTVVFKSASDTPWSGRLLADCLRDAGFPPGAFNYLNGNGSEIGQTLVDHPRTAGVTFTGSFDVGMRIYRAMAAGAYPRPCIAEMGGKNACVVTANADLERAATGIVRSAFGMGGQKCSALSRVYADATIADALIENLLAKIQALRIGDPSLKENWLGPVATPNALTNYGRYSTLLAQYGGRVLAGARRLDDGELAHGYFVAPTLVEAPADHPLFREEMFLPIVMLCRVKDREEALRLANDSPLGLTAGCYGSDDDLEYFFEHIEAGVTYANRPQGATTGAWPGYQPFGGWKGSGSTGKAIASFYYLAQYLREQSRTVVE
ncbi:aldehyde dehydrogenase family protein [Pseudoxanthomonas sacheonensis]|uniref:L-glutamate gamma-semialdehyde dehydrogenase n=1 Tax=Pseudoxanthomonas sacheonensis TaxID=443615 RepID=A0ABU1RV86_9GAMM|nr:aldehyde dehydrogenase family protein [Pseudoxanthomonas sacheonensis]MDR6842695.1 1-pyrroline-5-carboxylate dehydrogenase [Pseudoxanthomonas sacheonensis]